MSSLDFDVAFEQLTGNGPFPWQRNLYHRFTSDGDNNIPASCNLPTGLGKTSVIAVWLIALANHPKKLPRRLVYVVNRRTVVDQTTNEVEKLRANLSKLKTWFPELAISTLRGQFADNREWSADPSRPAVICGTVDMIGSRLLFSGYGIGFKGKPLHAGFLGQDTLVVHDEAHLEPAFQELLVAIEKEQRHCKEFGVFRVMELSATSRSGGDVFELSAEDKTNSTVDQRINAAKAITFHPVDDEKKEVAETVIGLAKTYQDKNRAIVIFVRSVEAVTAIVGKLPKGQVQQLTGTLRGLERDRMADPRKETGCPIFARFLKPPKADAPDREQWKVVPKSGTVYLVCTSAGEVGVNISGDDLICDLSTFESMAQRFGRVNRFGERQDSKIQIVHPTEFDEDDKLDIRRSRTLELLKALPPSDDGQTVKGSPAALGTLDLQSRMDAFTPEPTILPVSGILFDAWALTSIRDTLPGRPPVADFLHGEAEWEPPQTQMAWRQEVWELGRVLETPRDKKEFEHEAADLLEDYPVKNHELLRDRTDRVFNALKKMAVANDTPAWVVDDEGTVTVTNFKTLTERDKDDLAGKLLLLPPQAGGLDNGLLTAASKYDATRMDYDVADKLDDDRGPLRSRQMDDDTRPPGMKKIREIVIGDGDSDDGDGPPTKTWYWFVRPGAAEAEDAKADREYGLQDHLDDAKDAALGFVTRLGLRDDLAAAVVVAAQFHDLGKDRKRWQTGIGNGRYPDQKWAKSGSKRAVGDRSGYRHEFGSLSDVVAQAAFAALPDDMKDLTLHLIAAHHGRARPHFPVGEDFDDHQSPEATTSLAIETPRRFARMQRRYGRWGLAYLESLVRAADVAASRKAEGSAS